VSRLSRCRSSLAAAFASALVIVFSLAVVFSLNAHADPASDALTAANASLQAGRADEAIQKLNDILKSNPNSAEANNLLCRVEMTLQQYEPAISYCEKAVAANGQNARYHLWLGRAYGERASRVAFTAAFSLAKKTHAEFETAVKLDPKDADALSDLGEFCVDAPGFLGGGLDKATAIADKLDAIDAARGHHLRAAIAEKNKDLTAAEEQFKAAIKSSAHPASDWMDLASFYRRHDRWDDMQAAIATGQAAAQKDKHSATAFESGASVLVRANRDPQLAIKLFESYIASPNKTEDAPAFDVLARLAKLRWRNGDHPGAERDKAAALALAHDYKPALESTKDDKSN
jgi:tetratricopeptide (TPR) repeat protein